MKASKLASRVGVSRQWLSKLAQCGLVPDATRLPNGRWSYKNTPALRSWVKRAEATVAADKRRVLSKHAREATRLRELMARPNMTMGRAKEIRSRLDELAARPGPWSVWEIAEHTGWSVRTVQRMAKDVPGAIFDGGKFEFPRTAELAEWLFVQRGRFHAKRQSMRSAKRPSLRQVDLDLIRNLRATTQHFVWKMRSAFFAEKAMFPLCEWTTGDVQNLLDDVEMHTRVVCDELRGELERRHQDVPS